MAEAAARGAAKPTAPPAPPKPAPGPTRDAYIGIDIGTSGCRAVAIDAAGAVLAQAEAPLPPSTRNGAEVTQDPMQWWAAMHACLKNVAGQIDARRVRRLAIAGTSATLLLCDKQGNPVTPGLMYNDARAQAQAERIAGVADPKSAAHGATGSLAKLLWLQGTKSAARAAHALHQADWLAGRLAGTYGHSDYNNCLKLGYDVERLAWPEWFAGLEVRGAWLPDVHAPGDVIGTLSGEVAGELGLPADTEIAAGTSDGVASFLAAGASAPGHGVTSLGTTLVLKLLSERPVFSPPHGVYSHRLGRHFLAGGASNSGGGVLRQYFSEEQMTEMTPLLTPDQPTDLEYYPLPDIGERFPLADPEKEPRLEPLPGDSVMFFQGILEGIARIEAQGYRLLAELGAPKVSAIWTTGSGSRNRAWTRIRERLLGVRLQKPRSEHAAYGAALLAAGIVRKSFQ
ncbi:carbohydrate kinase [Sulfurifustis variabilis]|uniref:Carbohydrate kinase n=1 Tax=Sulfurifustis variabilis TaxID=1675686 RepID=A0A1B4VDC8_9GAMM|nr:carbohydrate kinase [Sulfurifustis variabilis]